MKHLIPIVPNTTFDELLLVENHRDWLEPLAPDIGKPDKLSPKGVMLVGLPGTGKASCVMATAKQLNRPVLRLPPNTGNVRGAFEELGRIPVVLWIDEPDDQAPEFLRCLSLHLDMADKVFVMATSSKPYKMSAELVHSTWFDRTFYHDLPDPHGRAKLWQLLIAKVVGNPKDYDTVVLSRASSMFTAAEIEAVARRAHTGKKNSPSEGEILAEIARKTPCALSMDEDLARLRHWACRYAEWIWRP